MTVSTLLQTATLNKADHFGTYALPSLDSTLLPDEIRRGKFGRIGTGGRGVVALRFDHNLDPFIAKVLPLLNARGLPGSMGVVTGSVGNLSAGYEPTAATWSDIETKLLATGIEVWAHSRTHSDGVSLADEIVNSKSDIEAASAITRVMGWQQPGGPATYGAAHTSAVAMNDAAGQLIRDTYGLYESSIRGTNRRTVPTFGCCGYDHLTIDALSVATIEGYIDEAALYGVGVELMLHSNMLDTAGMLTTAQLTTVLDYLAAKRDAGLIEVLTASGLAFADPGSTFRPSLIPYGDFEGQVTGTIPTAWASSGAAWTIQHDGGHSGNDYLRIPAGQTVAVVQKPGMNLYGLDGHAFEFVGWVRSVDYAPTWRVQFSWTSTTTQVIHNWTAAISQGVWTKVRLPVVVPKTTAILSVAIGRTGTANTCDWDDVSLVAV